MNKYLDVIGNYKTELTENDFQFACRIYQDGIEKYKSRLQQYGYINFENILDAGCGFGQWSLGLSELNTNVYSLEYSNQRVNTFKDIINKLNKSNINLTQGSIEELPYQDNTFDAVFCYGVIFLTDWKKSLKEFSRVLSKNGILYINANSYGWYRFLWDTEHNKNESYDPKHLASKVFLNTWKYQNNLDFERGIDIIIEEEELKQYLVEMGFTNITFAEEGKLNLNGIDNSKPFFKGTYKNELAVYEVSAVKN